MQADDSLLVPVIAWGYASLQFDSCRALQGEMHSIPV